MTTKPKSGAGVSRYLRLYTVLSQALAEGRFAARARLPSEPRLMKEYGISRSTVRRALARLEAEGRIERKRGSGTFARDQGQDAIEPRKPSPSRAEAAPPAATDSRTIAFQHIATPAFLLEQSPGFGSGTVLIRQIRYVEREPIALETVYVPEDIGGALTRRQLDSGRGTVLAVLAALGHRSAGLQREFAALQADPIAGRSLGLAVGTPLLNVRTLAHDPRHRVLAYINCLYRPDRYEARTAIDISARGRRKRKRS